MKKLKTIAVPALLCLLVIQCLMSMRLKSPTWDEPVYLSSGYAYLTRARFDLNREHPPFMKYLSALPLLFLNSSEPEEIPNWDTAHLDSPRYGASFLFKNSADAERLLFRGRCSTVFISFLTGALLWLWTFQLYGRSAGVIALLFYSFSPNILAHSRLITLDMGLTFGILLGCYSLWLLYRKPGAVRLLFAGISVGIALMIKTVALIFLLLIPIFALGTILGVRSNRTRGETELLSPLKIVFYSGATLLIALIVIAVGYGPYHFGLKEYLESLNLGIFNRDTIMFRKYEAFLWGRYSSTGFPLYFFFAFLVKTPLVTLLSFAAVIYWLQKRVPRHFYNELFLITPIVLFFALTIPLTDNLGLRYILPVYPFLFILIGGALSALQKNRVIKGVTAAFLGWYVISGCLTYPDYLSYFNEFTGGGKNGIEYLDESNIDWGQDLKQLARFVKEREIKKPVRIFYFPNYLTHYAISYYGKKEKLSRVYWATEMIWMTEIKKPQNEWYAVSAHLLQRSYLQENLDLRFDWLEKYEPVARVGNSIYVYHFGPPGKGAE